MAVASSLEVLLKALIDKLKTLAFLKCHLNYGLNRLINVKNSFELAYLPIYLSLFSCPS